ncbi:hypothetical protein SK128_012908, partial [Halocaridina rubra]
MFFITFLKSITERYHTESVADAVGAVGGVGEELIWIGGAGVGGTEVGGGGRESDMSSPAPSPAVSSTTGAIKRSYPKPVNGRKYP